MPGVTQAIYGWLAGSRHLIDVRFLFYSEAMLRVDEDSLALHLEVSLATAEPALVTNIRCGDAVARRRATAELARHLAVRLRCRSEEHTSELQSLMRISYAVFCLKKKKHKQQQTPR